MRNEKLRMRNGRDFVPLMDKIQRKHRAISDTRASNFPAYINVRENCKFRGSASRYFIKWILAQGEFDKSYMISQLVIDKTGRLIFYDIL